MCVECIICFGELKEDTSSFQSTPLTHETSPDTKKLKIVVIKSFSNTLILESYGGRVQTR